MADEVLGTEIAIVGMAGRYPKSADLAEFWRHLRSGDELISFFDGEDLLAQGADPALLRNPHFVKAAGVLEDMERFDAAFFGVLPREAELMDPQQRIFLECAWEALEHAGYAPDRYDGLIGVYAGAVENTYLLFNLMPNDDVRAMGMLPIMFANGRDYMPTRISYKLNLRGPSYLVQSACSTSLVAIHIACQSLINGECDMALAGGVSVLVNQRNGYMYLEGGIVSPDGRCRSFDADAQGTIFGSGLGVVVLKRLADALADGDAIHAVIRGSAVNNDGAQKVGYTAPSVGGQAEVIIEALAAAGVGAETISYVEAHGTATAIGDTIEIQALTQAFRTTTERRGFCAIGSVKSNLGHLDAAAGVTGVLKTVLALKHRQIPPSLHFETPNPKIDFEGSPFYVNAQLADWPAGPTPRRAGVSSFGIGGTNAHLILEEAPAQEAADPARPWQLLLLSAKTETALDAATAKLAGHLREHPDIHLADVAYTLQIGRSPFIYRRAIVCQDRDDAIALLTAAEAVRTPAQRQEHQSRPVVFLFPGQGAQYPNMGRGLYESEPLFRRIVDRCIGILRPLVNAELFSVLYPRSDDETEAAERLDQTEITQPLLFIIEYALARLWQSWNVRPSAMIGHSIGEYVAACLSGVLSLEDALRLVARRGALMQRLPAGAMLSVLLSEEALRPFLSDTISLAAVNAPTLCTLSGPGWAIDALQAQLEAQGVTTRRLHTSHAFHSSMMNPILEEFTREVQQVKLNPPQIPYLSNVTGTWIADAEATDPRYWTRHLRETVRFAEGLQTMLQASQPALLEVGPGSTLRTLARQQPGSPSVVQSLRHPTDQRADRATLLAALGQLWLAGAPIDWKATWNDERRRRIPLPTYPFERERYWIEADDDMGSIGTSGAEQPATDIEAGAQPHESAPAALLLKQVNSLRTGNRPLINQQRVLEQIVAAQLGILEQQLDLLRIDTSKNGKEAP